MVRDVLNTYMTPITLYQPPSTSVESLIEYELKLKLYNMIQASRKKDANKRRHDKQDPPFEVDKDSKKRKTQRKSSKEAKAPNKPSTTEKGIDDEELRQDDALDDAKLVKDDDIVDDEMLQDDDAPT
nr:hypothetical protein [Tanacetum cinerariifolium]